MKTKPFFSVIFAIAGLITSGWISYSALKETKRSRQIENEISALRNEAEKIKRNNEAMKEKIIYFETPEFKEKVAKEKLNLQKPDEQVTVIKPTPAVKGQTTKEKTTPEQKSATPETPNYLKWWDYFFKY